MANFEFNPIDDYIQLRFTCPNCGDENITDEIIIPSPNFEAENHSDSIRENEATHVCECGEEFEINIYNGLSGGDGDISNLDDDADLTVIEHCIDDDYIDEVIDEEMYSYLETSLKDIAYALEDIESVKERSKPLLYKVLYANIIACMESYLSRTYISLVFSSDKIKEKFTKTYKPFQSRKFELSEVFEVYKNQDTVIKKELRDVIYHDLPKVKGMYSDLGVDLGDISKLCKAVKVRHDIVHRNGKDKEGNDNNIDRESILNLITMVSDFINNIEKQVNILKVIHE